MEMNVEKAIEILNLQQGFDEDKTEFFFKEKPDDSLMYKVSVQYAREAIIRHEQALKDIAASDMIGGMQWHHFQQKAAWKTIQEVIENHEVRNFSEKSGACESHTPVEMGFDGRYSHGRCLDCGSTYIDL